MTVIDLITGRETMPAAGQTFSCAVGNFDGVHRGHAALLKEAAAKGGCDSSAVWTFRTHPKICSEGDVRLLTTLEQKLALFAQHGIEYVFIEDFENVRGLSPAEFAKKVLYNECNVRRAVCGFDFRFGKNAAGASDDLASLLGAEGAEVIALPPVKTEDGETISSSLVRKLIEKGEVARARELLGHPFGILLPVTEGRRIGRTIGVPTINQRFPKEMAVPASGVYASRCTVDGKTFDAVTSIGTRPTFSCSDGIVCETHIIGFSGDVYNRKANVELYDFIRAEKKFSGTDELAAAIRGDIENVKKYFG